MFSPVLVSLVVIPLVFIIFAIVMNPKQAELNKSVSKVTSNYLQNKE